MRKRISYEKIIKKKVLLNCWKFESKKLHNKICRFMKPKALVSTGKLKDALYKKPI